MRRAGGYGRRSGHAFVINTLNQLIALKERERTVVDHASHLIYLGDLLHYFLTGQITMSYTVNSISQLYNPGETGMGG